MPVFSSTLSLQILRRTFPTKPWRFGVNRHHLEVSLFVLYTSTPSVSRIRVRFIVSPSLLFRRTSPCLFSVLGHLRPWPRPSSPWAWHRRPWPLPARPFPAPRPTAPSCEQVGRRRPLGPVQELLPPPAWRSQVGFLPAPPPPASQAHRSLCRLAGPAEPSLPGTKSTAEVPSWLSYWMYSRGRR